MRSLEERMAEITRRSEEMIKKRKRHRNHLLAACIPVVLFICLSTLYILPDWKQDSTGIPESFTGEGTVQPNVESTSLAVFPGSVEVSGMGISHSYTDPEDIRRITRVINGIIAAPEAGNDEIKDYENIGSNSATSGNDSLPENGFTITVTCEDGAEVKYLLLDSLLINQETLEEFVLTEKEASELKEALDILRPRA